MASDRNGDRTPQQRVRVEQRRPLDPMDNWLMKPALEWLEQTDHKGDKELCKMIASLLRDLWRQVAQSEITPTAPDRLVKIELDGSTHVRTAKEWIDLSRVDLRGPAVAAPSAEPPQDWKDIFAEYRADFRSDAWLYQQIEAHSRRAAPSAGTPRTEELDWLHRFLNCSVFGPPTSEIQRAHAVVEKLERELADKEDDVRRLHADKMALLEKYEFAPRSATQPTAPITDNDKRWRFLEHGCKQVSWTPIDDVQVSFDPRTVTGFSGDLRDMRGQADIAIRRHLNVLRDGLNAAVGGKSDG